MADVRSKLAGMQQQASFQFLEGDFTVPVDGGDESHIPKSVAIELTVASRIARDWDQVSADLEGGISVTLESVIKQVRGASSLNELLATRGEWGPVLQVLMNDQRSGGQAIHQLQQYGVPESLQQSGGTFFVDSYPGQDPISVHRDIAAGIVDTLREATSSERAKIIEQMRGWQQWITRTRPAEAARIPQMVDVYRSVMIPATTLRETVSDFPGIKDRAIEKVRWNGGFLAEPSEADLRLMIEHGCAQVLLDQQGKDLIGYYGVLTDPAAVRDHLKSYGWDESKMGHYKNKSDLTSGKGRKSYKWTSNQQLVMEMFNDPDSVAVSVEVAVDETKSGSVSSRRSGAATALKRAVYQQALKQGKKLVLVRYFDIQSINGKRLSGAKNSASGIFTELLGGMDIGYYREKVTRDGVDMDVDWQLSLADIAQSLKVIESGKK